MSSRFWQRMGADGSGMVWAKARHRVGASRQEQKPTFRCRRCGTCCTKDLVVKLLNPDIEKLLEIMTVDELLTKLTGGGADSFFFFLSSNDDGSCVFYDRSKGCTIYEHRPLACRAYPGPTDATCPNRGMRPTREMARAQDVGDRESIALALLGRNYYPANVMLAWEARNRPLAVAKVAVAYGVLGGKEPGARYKVGYPQGKGRLSPVSQIHKNPRGKHRLGSSLTSICLPRKLLRR